MEANKAPEKIYLQEPTKVRTEKKYDNDVEYTRTDAFIEKTIIWLNNNFMAHDEYGVISHSFDTKEEMLDDFREYMKG